MLATKMLGEPHDEKPLEILNPAYRYYDYEFERYWHFYRLWGRLTYNPETPADVWEHEFSARFGPQAGPPVMNGRCNWPARCCRGSWRPAIDIPISPPRADGRR